MNGTTIIQPKYPFFHLYTSESFNISVEYILYMFEILNQKKAMVMLSYCLNVAQSMGSIDRLQNVAYGYTRQVDQTANRF